MTTTNDVTGDKLKSKPSNDRFRENFDKIFGKPDKEKDEKDKESNKKT